MKKGWLFWSYKPFQFFGSYITEHHDRGLVEQKMKAMMERDAYIVSQETLKEC
ncbi:hypothetical protein PQC38_gp059 [Aeromonas phage BUCT695]|uniref:hypothetical protein n=1 Tax=Aeromonas phage BUCT695 TaxID=2908630 RepID=UPI002329579C|nr:hypothetical protein PQC38_gp059 [Aeromonas phage BUCT695]UIW10535.1 hypothetical protein [Aeromonas phage BUCT695]